MFSFFWSACLTIVLHLHHPSLILVRLWSYCLRKFVACMCCFQDFTVPEYRTHMQDAQGRRRPSLLSEFHPGTERLVLHLWYLAYCLNIWQISASVYILKILCYGLYLVVVYAWTPSRMFSVSTYCCLGVIHSNWHMCLLICKFVVCFCSSGLQRDAMVTSSRFTLSQLSLSTRPWKLNALAWRLLLRSTLPAHLPLLAVLSCPCPIQCRTA